MICCGVCPRAGASGSVRAASARSGRWRSTSYGMPEVAKGSGEVTGYCGIPPFPFAMLRVRMGAQFVCAALPDVGGDGAGAQRGGEGFALVADGEVLRGIAGVGDD